MVEGKLDDVDSVPVVTSEDRFKEMSRAAAET
jgi:hypothetical protein